MVCCVSLCQSVRISTTPFDNFSLILIASGSTESKKKMTQDVIIPPEMFSRWQLEVDCRGIMGTTLEVEEEGTTTTYTVNADDEDQSSAV